jgi:adenylate cyclase
LLGFSEGLAGHPEATRNIIQDFRQLSKTSHVSPYYFGILEMGLGEMDTAYNYLEKAYEEHDGIMIFLAADPVAERAWGDPRFAGLVKKMGLHLRPQRNQSQPR